MTHYTNHSIHVQDDADGSAIVIGSLISCDAPIENEIQSDATGGRFYPEQITVASQKPMINASTYDLPKVIDAFGVVGRKIIQGAAKPGVALSQAQYNDSSLVAGSTHRRLRFAESYTKINRISASHRQDATIDFTSMALWDGTNLPVVPEGSVALPTLPSSPGRWTLHSVVVDEITIDCNIQVEIDFGVAAQTFGCDSDLYDTHLEILEIKPRITITGLTPNAFFTSGGVPLAGLVGAHADTKIILRKRLANQAGFVADATAEHISITAAGILLVSNAHTGQGNQRAQISYTMDCVWDGTNVPIVFDTTYNIA
jgi:hypothetical protein